MEFNAQTLIALCVVGACVFYVARRMYKTWFSKAGGCAGGCGCEGAPDQADRSASGHH